MRVSTEDVCGWFSAVALTLGLRVVGDWQEDKCLQVFLPVPRLQQLGKGMLSLRGWQARQATGQALEVPLTLSWRTWASGLVYSVSAAGLQG